MQKNIFYILDYKYNIIFDIKNDILYILIIFIFLIYIYKK